MCVWENIGERDVGNVQAQEWEKNTVMLSPNILLRYLPLFYKQTKMFPKYRHLNKCAHMVYIFQRCFVQIAIVNICEGCPTLGCIH